MLFQLSRQKSSFSVSLSFPSRIGAEKHLFACASLSEIHNGKQFLPLLPLLGVLLLCLIQDKNCLAASKSSCNGRNTDLNPFAAERRKSPFHLIAQNKGLSPVLRRAGTGKDLGYNTGKVL